MRLKNIVPALAFLATSFGYCQKYNCDEQFIRFDTYEFALQHLDSLKKHTKDAEFTVEAMVSKGKLESLAYFTAYGTQKQKKIIPWQAFDDNMKVLFSLCPDSYFYDATAQLNKIVFTVPLHQNGLEDGLRDINARTGYYKRGENYVAIPENAKYTLDLKELSVSGSGIAGKQLSGTMKGYNSGILELSPEFYIVLKLDTASDPKTVYLSYKFIETINYKAVVITEEKRRPLINGGNYIKVSGTRENDGIPAQENKNFSAEFSIRFE